MLNNLLFYVSGSLGNTGAKFYYDTDLPLFWDKDRKCIMMNLSLSDKAESTLKFYHDKGFMRFNDSGCIEEFIALYGDGPYDIYEEFSKNWGDWDFSTIMNFGNYQVVYPPAYKKLVADYPEFILDTGDYVEEKVGIELQDGMGILPFLNVNELSLHIRKLANLFFIRERYLQCEEVLLSTEYSSWIEDISFSYLKERFRKHFDVSTFKLVGSKTTERDKFKVFLDQIESALADPYNHPGALFFRYVCGESQYFLETFFTLEASTDAVEEFFTNGELNLPGLRSCLEKIFYGSSDFYAFPIVLDSPRVSFMVTHEGGYKKTFTLTTTVCFV